MAVPSNYAKTLGTSNTGYAAAIDGLHTAWTFGELDTVSGTPQAPADITTSANGEVIEGYDIQGRLTIAHDNVTVRNCQAWQLKTTSYTDITGTTVDFCRIGSETGSNVTSDATATIPKLGVVAVDLGQCTVRYCEVFGFPDFFKPRAPSQYIYRSWLHSPFYAYNGPAFGGPVGVPNEHMDAWQLILQNNINSGPYVMQGCKLEVWGFEPGEDFMDGYGRMTGNGGDATSAIFLHNPRSSSALVENMYVYDCYIDGRYTSGFVYVNKSGGGSMGPTYVSDNIWKNRTSDPDGSPSAYGKNKWASFGGAAATGDGTIYLARNIDADNDALTINQGSAASTTVLAAPADTSSYPSVSDPDPDLDGGGGGGAGGGTGTGLTIGRDTTLGTVTTSTTGTSLDADVTVGGEEGGGMTYVVVGVHVGSGNTDDVTGVTINGEAMTKLSNTVGAGLGAGVHSELYGLHYGPGQATITMSKSTSEDVALTVIGLTNIAADTQLVSLTERGASSNPVWMGGGVDVTATDVQKIVVVLTYKDTVASHDLIDSDAVVSNEGFGTGDNAYLWTADGEADGTLSAPVNVATGTTDPTNANQATILATLENGPAPEIPVTTGSDDEEEPDTAHTAQATVPAGDEEYVLAAVCMDYAPANVVSVYAATTQFELLTSYERTDKAAVSVYGAFLTPGLHTITATVAGSGDVTILPVVTESADATTPVFSTNGRGSASNAVWLGPGNDISCEDVDSDLYAFAVTTESMTGDTANGWTLNTETAMTSTYCAAFSRGGDASGTVTGATIASLDAGATPYALAVIVPKDGTPPVYAQGDFNNPCDFLMLGVT